MLTDAEKEYLKQSAKEIRKNIVMMIHSAKSGHPGGSLSGADILSVLYLKSLNIPQKWDEDENFENRDRFILSKGHASPLLYAVLAEKGLIDKDSLMTFRKINSKLQGHPSRGYLKGIETSTGSLGHGLSIGCGMAMALKLNRNPAHVVVYLGDGEMQEGSVWEALMQGAHRNLNNLIPIIDKNGLQIDGSTDKVMSLKNLSSKLTAFGWEVIEINGHDFDEIYNAVERAKTAEIPTAIIADTIKGKGVSYMENKAEWHGKAPDYEQLETALRDLE